MKRIGIYIDGEKILLAQVAKKKFSIIKLQTISIASGNVKKLHKRLFAKKNLVAGLDLIDVVIEKVKFPVDNPRAIKKGINFQEGLDTNFYKNRSVSAFLFKKNQKEIQIVKTTKEKIENLSLTFERLHIYPRYLSSVANALARFFNVYATGYSDGIVFYFGTKLISCIYVKENTLEAFHEIRIESEALSHLQNYAEFLQENKEEGESKKLFQLKQQLTYSFLSFLQISEKEKLHVLLLGNLDCNEKLKTFLFSDLKNKISSFIEIPQNISKSHAISIGLAIDSLIKDENSVQFFQKDMIPKKQIKKFSLQLAGAIILCLLINTSMITMKNKYFKKWNSKMYSHLDILQTKDHELMEKEIILHKTKNIENDINAFETTLTNENRSFVFPMRSKDAKQVLTWLCNNYLNETCFIEKFHYQLESFPTIEDLKKNYIAKVLIQLKFLHHADALKFQKKLLQDPFLNRKKPFQVECEGDFVTASFYPQN